MHQIVDAVSAGVEVEDYLRGIDTGVCHEEIMAAHEAGMVLSDFVNCLRLGATSAEVTEIHQLSIPSSLYCRTLELGIPHWVLRAGVRAMSEQSGKRAAYFEIEAFVEGCGSGFYHEELLAAVRSGISLSGYTKCRETGATHAEILEACGPGKLAVYDYDQLVGATIPHDEVMSIRVANVSPMYYAGARQAGASRREVAEACEANVYLPDYSRCTKAGATHEQILEAALGGIDDLRLYVWGLGNGVTHVEMLCAPGNHYQFSKYLESRIGGADQEEALRCAGPLEVTQATKRRFWQRKP
jgi:hypothetical protein